MTAAEHEQEHDRDPERASLPFPPSGGRDRFAYTTPEYQRGDGATGTSVNRGEGSALRQDGSTLTEAVISPATRRSDTEVREIVKPAITREVIREENREHLTTAVDRELHQDHYQTRVQPIIDRQVLAEEHKHRAMPVVYKEHRHNKEKEIERAIEEERSRFKSTREVLQTKHIVEAGPTVVGEHHHHHVYETVQPVIEREIIQPIVTHTTVPIHERIEKDPSFHPKTIQPVMTMEEFLRRGGTIDGMTERRDIFEGEPQVMENGGADQAWDARGHHIDAKTGLRNVGGGPAMTEGVAAMLAEKGSVTSGLMGTSADARTNKLQTPPRSGSPLTAGERERIQVGGIGRSRSPLGSLNGPSANRTSAF